MREIAKKEPGKPRFETWKNVATGREMHVYPVRGIGEEDLSRSTTEVLQRIFVDPDEETSDADCRAGLMFPIREHSDGRKVW